MHFYHMSGILLGTEYTEIRDNQPLRTSPYSINNTAITAQCDKEKEMHAITGTQKGVQWRLTCGQTG